MDEPLDNFTLRMNFPFLHGVYLAVNAIPDAFLFMDSSDCSFFLAENIQGNHDWNSTLLDCMGFHRIVNTGTDIRNIAHDRTEDLNKILQKIESSGKANLILMTSMPLATVLAIQYDKIVRGFDPPPSTPIAEIQNKSLSEDWLQGYSDTLKAAAQALDLSGGEPSAANVAIVGYMMDRTEDDHLSNIHELKRILKDGLGLNLVSVWPDNSPVDRLSRIKEAGTIISFPYGRAAARIIARKTNAALIETEVPFGLEPTRKWIMQIAEVFGADARASEFIKGELRAVVPKFEWVLPHVFFGKRIVYCGDPHLIEGLGTLASDFGFAIAGCAAFAREAPHKEYCVRLKDFVPCVRYEPKPPFFVSDVFDASDNEDIDLLIANNVAAGMLKSHTDRRLPLMEFGYPSHNYHALFDSPFLGFRGAACFLNRMANTIAGSSR